MFFWRAVYIIDLIWLTNIIPEFPITPRLGYGLGWAMTLSPFLLASKVVKLLLLEQVLLVTYTRFTCVSNVHVLRLYDKMT